MRLRTFAICSHLQFPFWYFTAGNFPDLEKVLAGVQTAAKRGTAYVGKRISTHYGGQSEQKGPLIAQRPGGTHEICLSL
jgi:hypothetical protein